MGARLVRYDEALDPHRGMPVTHQGLRSHEVAFEHLPLVPGEPREPARVGEAVLVCDEADELDIVTAYKLVEPPDHRRVGALALQQGERPSRDQ